MEAVDVQLHTVLTSAPDTVERPTAHLKESVELEFHTFIISAPDSVER